MTELVDVVESTGIEDGPRGNRNRLVSQIFPLAFLIPFHGSLFSSAKPRRQTCATNFAKNSSVYWLCLNLGKLLNRWDNRRYMRREYLRYCTHERHRTLRALVECGFAGLYRLIENRFNQLETLIMANQTDLNTALDGLEAEATIDQEEIKAAFQALQDAIDNGATGPDLQPQVDRVTALTTGLAAFAASFAGQPAPAPTDDTQPTPGPS